MLRVGERIRQDVSRAGEDSRSSGLAARAFAPARIAPVALFCERKASISISLTFPQSSECGQFRSNISAAEITPFGVVLAKMLRYASNSAGEFAWGSALWPELGRIRRLELLRL